MNHSRKFLAARIGLTRRRFLRAGAAGLAGLGVAPLWAQRSNDAARRSDGGTVGEYLTREEKFRNVGRGKPPPCDLPEAARRAAGLTPETWALEVVPDPDSDSKLDRPLTKTQGTALNWEGLMRLAETRAVRFLHVVTCTNLSGPLGMGLWEGVPLREILWLTRPVANIRRVFYHGYHNNDPAQRFQSSLTLDRALEDPPGEWPVILCYKLNGQWLTPKRGGPVRMVVPGFYGNKSVKWLQRIALTNNPRLNDTYAEWNNDTESRLKTCAFFEEVPEKIRAGEPVTITGLAQVGIAGLRAVQYFVQPKDDPLPADDPWFTRVTWTEAEVLPPPDDWGGGLPEGRMPAGVKGFNAGTGRPREWPMRDSVVHWKAVRSNLAPGRYDLRCRTIDANGAAQPLPRPILKSGRNDIQRVSLVVEG